EEGEVVADVVGNRRQDPVARAERECVERHVPGSRRARAEGKLLRARADQVGGGAVEALDGVLLRGVRLVAADPRLELEMADGRVENGLRRERRAGVVQVHDVLAARRVGAGALDVDSVRSLAALHLGLILPNYG